MLAENTFISHYRILSRIGEGGMGEVYLAEDTRLGRRIALKLLSAQSDKDVDRLRRFEQEARAASALNHPNIITIHEISSEGGMRFIAMEFVEGETVRERLRRGTLELREALDVAVQVASALGAAHRVGILHRDIKPENVMLRPDGIAKVLDFGVAKLTEKFAEHASGSQPARPEDGEIRTLGLVTTEANIVMGSPNYMSPEQARGLAVDARTDIFSLGTLIYEMLTGTMAFKGDTVADVIVSIIERQPQPFSECLPEAPPRLDAIVSRAMAKAREDRYQSIDALLDDLKRMRRRMEVEAGSDDSFRPPGSDLTPSTASPVRRTAEEISVRSDRIPTVRATSSAEYVVSEIKRHKRGFLLALLVTLLSIAAIGYFAFSSRPHPMDSIAVLPFANESADPNTEYLSEGLTESLINNLSQSRSLKVMSRNAVFKYKGREADAKAAARELGVHGVLTGRIAQRGDNISINVELIDSRDDTQVWGEQYNRQMGDLFTLQEQIARDVSEKLQLKLSGEDEKRVTKRYTNNADAYQLYLKGRFYWNKRTEDGLTKGADYFKQAIDKDPTYALAYAGLADCYALLYEYSAAPSKDLYPKAKAAATRALELDSSLAEPHTSLAAASEYEWNWAEAEKQYAEAIELNPNYETAHHWYSAYLIARKRFDEAIGESRRALELDPLSLIINTSLGRALHCARRYDEAIEQLRKTVDLDPNFAEAHFHLALAYEGKRSYDDAIRELERYIELSGDKSMKAWIGRIFAESGRKQQGMKALEEVIELSKRGQLSPYFVATLYAALGDRERAFEWLEKLYRERNYYVVFLNADPALDGLRGDPRFADLLQRIGLD
ncbi:MAG TPA: protein kinase [Blastocatellia bacterium]|nr:protein kinase [Blastocatellia bacterium]